MIPAALAAFAAAFAFALGSALQQRVDRGTTPDEESQGSFFGRLAGHPSWLVGLLLSAVAFALHAFALHAFALSRGDLALVQPIIVSDIVFAVVIRAALEHRFPAVRTLGWLVITWAGLALFLTVRPPTADDPPKNGLGTALVGLGVVLALVGMFAASRTRTPQLRGALLAGASGVLFGLVAGLITLVLAHFGDGVSAVLGSWSLWALVVTGLWAVLLNQRAYQTTRLSVTTPILNVRRGRRGDPLRAARAGRGPRAVAGDHRRRGGRARPGHRRGGQAGLGRRLRHVRGTVPGHRGACRAVSTATHGYGISCTATNG